MLCHTLAKTGVFEQMAANSRTVDEMADACQVRRDVLYRALRLTTALEITTRQDDRYALADLGRMMLKDTPGSMINGVLLVGTEGYRHPWQNFAYSLTTGESAKSEQTWSESEPFSAALRLCVSFSNSF